MAKQTGLGMNFYLGGYDLSGDTQQLGTISGSVAPLDVTDITQSAHSRLGGLRDSNIEWTSYFDPTGSHVALSALPTAPVIATVLVSPLAVGSPACSAQGLQINYDPTRAADGMLTAAVKTQGQSYGLEWGTALTAGKRTDTAATAGAVFDNGASYAYGAQAYLQVFSFSGTDATVAVQHATSSGGSYSNLIAFTQITSSTPQAQRATVSNSTTVDEFLKVTTTTSGGFTSLVFAVMVNVNTIAGVVF